MLSASIGRGGEAEAGLGASGVHIPEGLSKVIVGVPVGAFLVHPNLEAWSRGHREPQLSDALCGFRPGRIGFVIVHYLGRWHQGVNVAAASFVGSSVISGKPNPDAVLNVCAHPVLP